MTNLTKGTGVQKWTFTWIWIKNFETSFIIFNFQMNFWRSFYKSTTAYPKVGCIFTMKRLLTKLSIKEVFPTVVFWNVNEVPFEEKVFKNFDIFAQVVTLWRIIIGIWMENAKLFVFSDWNIHDIFHWDIKSKLEISRSKKISTKEKYMYLLRPCISSRHELHRPFCRLFGCKYSYQQDYHLTKWHIIDQFHRLKLIWLELYPSDKDRSIRST